MFRSQNAVQIPAIRQAMTALASAKPETMTQNRGGVSEVHVRPGAEDTRPESRKSLAAIQASFSSR